MRLAVLTTYLTRWGHIDALRKEARILYGLLNQERPHDEIFVVSVEDEINPVGIDMGKGIFLTSFERLNELIDKLALDVIHIIEATPFLLAIILKGRTKLPCKVIVNCVDNNPLEGINENDLEDILHISEYNECHFFCYSEHAQEVLKKAGIRNVSQTLPLLDSSFYLKEVPKANQYESTMPLNLGFASSPFHEDSFSARGLNLIVDLLRQDKTNFNLKIPWREESLSLRMF
ncbi:hypothetical protein [Syntrophomonas palmitatica]|uniref:hypothetical protein n=1 Tax=Syntrophomonas palmitatica TaxID=402877 RepID=UPI0006D162CE|nr:hypothetical protein [Syntrophomonas palmitatica]